MPIQVHGVLVHAMSCTELSRVRTEFGPFASGSNKSSLESRGPTLLCNQLDLGIGFAEDSIPHFRRLRK